MAVRNYSREAKILLFDLEVSPTLMWGYGQYDTHALKVEQPPVLLSMAWKWVGDRGKPQCLTIQDCHPLHTFDHSELVRELWKLMDEAEVVVAHNINFDRKVANGFFLREGLNPPSWYKPFCTLQTARKYFKLDNNKLDYLGKLLCGDSKTSTTHADTWHPLLFGDDRAKKKAAKLMKRYNIQDVVLLEKIYNKLLPYADNHPNVALAAGIGHICPRCGREAEFSIKAYRKTCAQVNAVQLQCSECGGYITRPLTPEEREEFADHGTLKSLYRNITN